MSRRLLLGSFTLILPLGLLGCGGDSDGTATTAGPSTSDGGANSNGNGDGGTNGGSNANGGGNLDYLGELEETGLFDYLGQFTPASESEADGVTTYTFDVTPEGPQCIDGSPFKMGVRDQGSDSLLFYLQGGGACWTGFEACSTAASEGVPDTGGFKLDDSDNPVVDWNHIHVSYCDGSLFVGDIEKEDGKIQHGRQNLSAAIDLAKEKFPDVTRIMLAGSSAGGFGTIWATAMVRKTYPDAQLLVFNDAGIGVAKPNDPDFRRFLEEDWGAEGLMPDSCSECATSAHTTPLIGWGLERDTELKTAMFSSYGDDVIAGAFLMISDEEFEAALLEETDALHDANPERLKRFFIEGGQHTALGSWGTTMKDGVSLREWTTAMIEGDAAWTDMP